MKLTKKSEILIIVSFYLIALFLSPADYFSGGIIDSIRRSLPVILAGIMSLIIFYDNRRNLKVLLKNKVPLILYCLTIFWFFLTFLFGIKTGIESFKGFIHFSVLLTYVFTLFNVSYTEENKKIIKKHIFIAFLISVFIGVIQYVFEINLNTYNNAKYPGILGRINSTFYIATLFDKFMVMMFPVITYELLNDKGNKWYKLLLAASMIGVTLTFSRSGQLIYLVMAFVFFVITLFKKQYKNSILMVVLISIMILIPGAKYSVQSALDYAYETVHMPKVLQIDFVKILNGGKKPIIKDVEAGKCADSDCVGDEEGSKFFRDYYKKVGMALLKERPIFGVGVGNYYYLYINQNARDYLTDDSIISDEYHYMYPHNGYIQVLCETGYVGLILISSFFLSIALTLLIKSNNKLNYYLLIMLIVGFSMSSITECLFHSKQYIYLFAIIYGVYCSCFTTKISKKIKKA